MKSQGIEASGQCRIERVRARASGCPGERHLHELESNVWMVGDDRDVVIVDPVDDPAAIIRAIGERQVTAVICTQGHRDQISAAMEVGLGWCAPVLLHPTNHSLWEEVHGRRAYWRLDDGQRIAIAGENLLVLHTPSATPGSVALYIARFGVVFVGNTLNSNSSDVWTELAELPTTTRICPARGDSFLLREAISCMGRAVEYSA
ncbi:MBL fold metallo-hydrolase [Rhodococcus sp. IEGM 1304]|uniref:MBL fold metallo-hydrolase n=1 Tax=Rhodococcus sp. IEGM 1304 TaxID=3082227 RepID=UPI003989262B